MSAPRVLVVHPPVSVARDFIDYPYVADLGAVQLAAVLERTLGAAQIDVVDAYALPGAGLALTALGFGAIARPGSGTRAGIGVPSAM